MMQEVVFIETAMPSALLGAVFARHYHCKPELVSMIIVITLFISIFSVSALFLLMF
jgi:predicted permease